MTAWLRRALAFAAFTLTEYARSGRVLVELAALAAFVWVALWPHGTSTGLNVQQLFTLGGAFVLALTVYTTGTVFGLGSRPQGYVVLVRPLGRSGYLVGLYLASLALAVGVYLLLTVGTPLLYRALGQPVNLSLGRWALATLPLLLDVAIVAAFTALLTPLVLAIEARLALLAVFAVGLSFDLDPLGRLGIGEALRPLQTALKMLLLPATAGFHLAGQPTYAGGAAVVLLAQAAMAAALLAVALLAFRVREIVLTP